MAELPHEPVLNRQRAVPVGLTVLVDGRMLDILTERIRTTLRGELADQLAKVAAGPSKSLKSDQNAVPVPATQIPPVAAGVELTSEARARAAELRKNVAPAKAQADDGGLIDTKTVARLLPVRLGLGKCCRWSVFELLEWVQAGCSRLAQWMEMRGGSGSCRKAGR